MTDDAVNRRWDLFSRVASTSAGVEVDNCEILVLGNADGSASDLVIGHDVMADAIDAAVRRALGAPRESPTIPRSTPPLASASSASSRRPRPRRQEPSAIVGTR